MVTSAEPVSPVVSGWAGLPRDILWEIFLGIPQGDVLGGAGLVCSAWWRFSRDEPALWRRINVTLPSHGGDAAGDYRIRKHWKGMVCAAVDRSAGHCEAFFGRADDDVLLYLAERAPRLRILTVISHYDVSSKVFAELLESFPLLEELELELKPGALNKLSLYADTATKCWAQLLQAACAACSNLSSFRVRHPKMISMAPEDFVIPKMRRLRSIHLFGDSFNRDMVLSIVDCCADLKSLDINDVPNLSRWDLKLLTVCSRIDDVTLPISYTSEESDDDESTDSDSDYFSG